MTSLSIKSKLLKYYVKLKYSVILFIVSMVLKKMHEFTLFRQPLILNDYYFYENNMPQFYYFGVILGILAFGFLSDNALKRKIFMTIAFVTLL
jgi:uncharacterized membrane protein